MLFITQTRPLLGCLRICLRWTHFTINKTYIITTAMEKQFELKLYSLLSLATSGLSYNIHTLVYKCVNGTAPAFNRRGAVVQW